jgi:hypothetical protein
MSVGGKRMQGAERAAAIEHSGDQTVKDPEGRAARNLLASDCTPHRQWLPGGDEERERHFEPTQQLVPDDHHGPFTPVEQFGPSEFSSAGLPAGLTGPWALAAAVHVGFAEAAPMPFVERSPVDQVAMTRLIREALRPPSYGRYGREEPAWDSAWQASETGLVKVGTWQGEQKPHVVVVGNSADDFALAQGWHILFGNTTGFRKQTCFSSAQPTLWHGCWDMIWLATRFIGTNDRF